MNVIKVININIIDINIVNIIKVINIIITIINVTNIINNSNNLINFINITNPHCPTSVPAAANRMQLSTISIVL